jgi:beta-lactamase regulating signal transducer with metallopeptidase domain
MNPFFAWLIKSSVSLALLYILFRLAMHNDKTHSLNRFLLLAILLVSTVIPFLEFQFFYEEVPLKHVEVFREFVSTPVSVPDVAMSEVSQVQTESSASFNLFLIFYISAVLVLLIRLFISVIRVMQIIGQAEKRKLSKIVLAIVKDLIQPFSFFNKIILSEKDFTDNKDIVVAHEYAHIKQLHAIDLVICELFTVLHFFNPFMWLLRRDLKLVHEYQADQAVLNKGIDAKKYQLLVLEKSVGERRFAMANHFTQKPILKRIKMMQKKNKKQWAGMKLILFIPALAVLFMAFGKTGEKVLENESVLEKIVAQPEIIQNQSELKNFVIDIKNDGYYIGNKLTSVDEVVKRAKMWQKTGSEDILLVLDEKIALNRIDEIRVALSDAKVYHVNQKTINSDEIIYPAGDISKAARFTQGSWNEWWKKQLTNHIKDIPDDWEYSILVSFVIDKNGKVRDAHIVKGCKYPEINEAYEKILTQIPDWKPAVKSGAIVSVLYQDLHMKKNIKN